MKELATLQLTQQDFDALAAHCRRDPQFPESWDGWLKLMKLAKEQATAAGFDFPPVQLDLVAFVSWCKGMRIVPCIDALRAFAIIQRTPRESQFGAL